MDKPISLARIFAVFTKIGAFTIGGGYMMVPAIQNEMSKRHWISDEELPDIVAIAQGAPGLLTVNMAIFAGYKLRGVKGSIVATLGSIIAPFLIILAIAMAAANFKDNPYVFKALQGVRPVSVAIITAYMFKLARTNCKQWWQYLIAAVTLVLVALLKVSPIYILLTLIVLAVAITLQKERRAR
jgi:chromate transporter